MAWITNSDVANAFFRGKTVPGDNTIDSATNSSFVERATNMIKARFGFTDSTSDVNGLLKELSLRIYDRLLHDEYPLIDEGTRQNPGKDYYLVQDISKRFTLIGIHRIEPWLDW